MRFFVKIFVLGVFWGTLTACPGKDYMPVYFPTDEGDAKPQPEVTAPEHAACVTQFSAQLCVVIQGENVNIGDTADDPLCVDVPPIALEIDGSKISLRGDTFPNIVVEGHGLPVPITINGRGTGSGHENVGSGTIAGNGEIMIEGFDFFVTALDSVGKIPDITFTTGESPSFQNMPSVTGAPLTDAGAMTLVGGTTLGSLFPSADKYLLGATMMATFRGTITPTLQDCGGGQGQPISVEVLKIIIDNQGKEIAVPIPNGTQMEISTGTFIARSAGDIGPRFEGRAKFSLNNISEQALKIQLPPIVGPFQLEATGGLNRTLPAGGSMRLQVSFKPVHNLIEAPGTITETLTIGNDSLTLSAVAIEPQGKVAIDLLDRAGHPIRERIESLAIGDIFTTTSPQRAYFACDFQLCGGAPLPTQCQPCFDVTTNQCQLLTINADGHPLDAVDAQCELAFRHSHATQSINLGGDLATIKPAVRILAIRNIGTSPLTIKQMALQEAIDSASTGEFLFNAGAVFVADSVETIREQLLAPAAGESADGHANFPITLPPYEPPLRTTRAFVVVGYAPDDLLGSDGRLAGIGTTVTDQATLTITSDGIGGDLRMKGTTTIQESPALQVFFTTASGRNERPDGSTFSFRGITMETSNLAVPLFMRVTESATHGVRITGMRVEGNDAEHFEWLDSVEEIALKPEAARCSNPIFGPNSEILDVQTDLAPVTLAPNGYDLKPGTSLEAMPFFGCVNFRRDINATEKQRQFEAMLIIATQPLGPDKKPLRNPDGTLQQSEFRIPLLAVVDPMKGQMVFRITQTMSAMLNTQFPTVASAPSNEELATYIAAGKAKPSDAFLFIGAFILDPFDEETIANEQGEVLSAPNDGVTAVFRRVDTRPQAARYDDPLLRDYSNLSFDATAPTGQQGPFFDYPNVPEDLRTNSLKIFTSTLSYPGPLVPLEERPAQPSDCEEVDPCSEEGKQKFGSGPTEAGKKGVCAYFFTSAGLYDSPAFRYPEEMPGGERHDLCENRDAPQPIHDVEGTYLLDGRFHFDMGLRFWGPTYFHNPNGPLGDFPPLDEVWHLNLTTETLRPPKSDKEPNLIPDTRVNLSKQEYKINLNDPTLETPQICPGNTSNLSFQGENYSSWAYLKPLLSKDEEGLIPAGCPEPGSAYTGGSAFLHGRRLNHETGILSVVAVSKFSSRQNLTFVFKDVTLFIVMNGWLCDPQGDPAVMEGEHCYDLELNDRDTASQISVIRK